MTLQVADDPSQVLTPQAAAYLLGITPELLFAYALYPPKRHQGDLTRLQYVNDPGRSGFRRVDLQEFDQFLWGRWSEDAENRPAVPTYVTDYLKVESGGQCARCGKGYRLVNAHITPWAESLSHHHHNLVRLCSDCHDKYDSKHLIARAEMQSLKQRLILRLKSRLESPLHALQGVRAPNPSSHFFGREYEVGVLVELLQSCRTISIEGPPGIGKTQLLLHSLQHLPEERRVLWIDIQAFTSVDDIALALEAGLAASGIAGQGNSLFQVLTDTSVTIVFDGVEDLSPAPDDELTDFFQLFITQTGRPQILFTSQLELHGVEVAERFTVPPLEPGAGLLLLQWDHAERRTDGGDEDLLWLASFCEGHPLALTLVRGLLAYFKSAATVKRRVSKNGAAALNAPTRLRQTPSTSLRACMLVSYETLSPEQRNCLYLVSHCPAGCLDLHLKRDNEYLIEDVEADVAALLRWHLLDAEDWAGQVRLYILSPIRAFVLNEWETEPSSVKEKLRLHLTIDHAMQAMVLCHHHLQTSDTRYGVIRFDQEFPNFLYTFRHAVNESRSSETYLEFICGLASSLMMYCFVRGFFEVGVSIMRAGAIAAERLGRSPLAGPLLVQAIVLAKRARNPQAVQAAVAELNRISQDTTELSLMADAATGRGDLAILENRLDDAAREFAMAELNYRRAIEHRADNVATPKDDEPVKDEDRLNQMLALSLKMQGFTNERKGLPAAAIPFYEQALGLLADNEDSLNIGITQHQMGNCCAELGWHDQSFRSYTDAAERFSAIPVAEYLSNSLSEAGYLLLDWEHFEPGLPAISEELLCSGLEDIARQLTDCIAPWPDVPLPLQGEILRKLFGMVVLASFTEHNGHLAEWAYVLRETVIRPIAGPGKPVSGNPIFLMHVDLTLALAGSLSEVPQNGKGGPIATTKEVEHYAVLCYRFYDWGWEAFRVFDWLAKYLRWQRGIKGAEKDALRLAAETAVKSGAPFTL